MVALMKSTRLLPFFALAVFAVLAPKGAAQASRWGAPEEDTVKYIIACEDKWSSSSCSPQPDMKLFIAEDFQGTSTSGGSYGKQEAIASDGKYLARDCHLGEVKVRFFGEAIAIAYGAENRIVRSADGKESKRCQVWTDTWLKRGGKWEIVAAQDTIVPCAP
jgi:hypothetical protein